MISPNELRLNNYILIKGNIIARVVAIEPFKVSIGMIGGHDWVAIKDINPVPLTIDILTSYGFFKVEYGDRESHTFDRENFFQPLIQRENGGFDTILSDRCIIITSVHELQNMFHIITGKELGELRLTK